MGGFFDFGNTIGDIFDTVGRWWGDKERERHTDRRHKEQMEQQRKYAEHGVRWKVVDAKKAGLHPLAALGAQTMSYAPSRVFSNSQSGDIIGQGLGNIARRFGKDEDQTAKALKELQIDNMVLENEGLRLRNVGMNQNNIDRASPNRGTGDALIKEQPVKTERGAPGDSGLKAGAQSGVQIHRMKGGRLKIANSQELGEILESQNIIGDAQDIVAEAKWLYNIIKDPVKRAKFRKILINEARRAGKLHPGETVYFSKATGEFYAERLKSGKKWVKGHTPMRKRMSPVYHGETLF